MSEIRFTIDGKACKGRPGQSIVEAAAYLRIWRKEQSGTWKVCLDIELPLPESERKDREKAASPS